MAKEYTYPLITIIMAKFALAPLFHGAPPIKGLNLKIRLPAYGASVNLAEKAVQDLVAKRETSLNLAIVHDCCVFGPHYGGAPALSSLNVSTSIV
jgi:hypothetical protein